MNSEVAALKRIVEIARRHAGPVSQCCMAGEATGELCELHVALAEYDDRRLAGCFCSSPTGKTYRFSTFQEMVNVVPANRIRVCLEELGVLLAVAKQSVTMMAAQEGQELPEGEELLKLKTPLEWTDDGKDKKVIDFGKAGKIDLTALF